MAEWELRRRLADAVKEEAALRRRYADMNRRLRAADGRQRRGYMRQQPGEAVWDQQQPQAPPLLAEGIGIAPPKVEARQPPQPLPPPARRVLSPPPPPAVPPARSPSAPKPKRAVRVADSAALEAEVRRLQQINIELTERLVEERRAHSGALTAAEEVGRIRGLAEACRGAAAKKSSRPGAALSPGDYLARLQGGLTASPAELVGLIGRVVAGRQPSHFAGLSGVEADSPAVTFLGPAALHAALGRRCREVLTVMGVTDKAVAEMAQSGTAFELLVVSADTLGGDAAFAGTSLTVPDRQRSMLRRSGWAAASIGALAPPLLASACIEGLCSDVAASAALSVSDGDPSMLSQVQVRAEPASPRAIGTPEAACVAAPDGSLSGCGSAAVRDDAAARTLPASEVGGLHTPAPRHTSAPSSPSSSGHAARGLRDAARCRPANPGAFGLPQLRGRCLPASLTTR
eukprot:TRINITY_DN4285_c0_g1_i2.p1 TRINITY_DN4285_c0_g1~~TRINITY_DN4285_c0_g1_i2.p1  ORF type:complete len:487 (+),score=167.86 TRINITY_DN4285_c0_g1_i2:85-1461(+)